jgi:inorganic triphosphatase YgiF
MAVEIEAKFIVTDRMAFLELRERRSIGKYALTDSGTEDVRDTYLDTKDRKLMHAGYACRLRERSPEFFITLKSMSSREGDVHVRTEIEERIDDPGHAVRPELWPDGPARDLATRLGRGVVLGAIAEIRQTRWKREVSYTTAPGLQARAGSPLFELSLDEVRLPGLMFCVEVELSGGTAENLREIIAVVKKTAPLKPDPKSKLEHALDAAGIAYHFPL